MSVSHREKGMLTNTKHKHLGENLFIVEVLIYYIRVETLILVSTSSHKSFIGRSMSKYSTV